MGLTILSNCHLVTALRATDKAGALTSEGMLQEQRDCTKVVMLRRKGNCGEPYEFRLCCFPRHSE